MSRHVPLAVLSAVVVAVAATGCGSSSGSSSRSQQASAPGGGFVRNPKVAACLKKQGISFPARRRGRRTGPPAGTPTTPGTGTGRRPRFNPQRFAKIRAALAKCGIAPPNGPPGGGPPPGAPGTTTPGNASQN